MLSSGDARHLTDRQSLALIIAGMVEEVSVAELRRRAISDAADRYLANPNIADPVTCPNGCTVLVAPDLPPLDPTVDYGRDLARADADARLEAATGYRTPERAGRLRGRPVRGHDVPYWTAPSGYCRWCGHPIEEWTKAGKRRLAKRWHQACADHHLALGSQQGFRASVWARDGGVCAECPAGTPPCRKFPASRRTAFVDSYGRTGQTGAAGPHSARYHGTSDCQVPGCVGEDVHVRFRDVEGPVDDREWNADHVVPLWAGGEHTMENAQTLCGDHHKAKTRREAGDRARQRRRADFDEIPLFSGPAAS